MLWRVLAKRFSHCDIAYPSGGTKTAHTQ